MIIEREQRRLQLEAMSRTQHGSQRIADVYKGLRGIRLVVSPTGRDMIEAILDKQYPREYLRRVA